MNEVLRKVSALSTSNWLKRIVEETSEGSLSVRVASPREQVAFALECGNVTVSDISERRIPLLCVGKPLLTHAIIEWAHQSSFDIYNELSTSYGSGLGVLSQVSMADLLSHTSGLEFQRRKCHHSTLADGFGAVCPRGLVYSYSDAGFEAAAAIVESLSGLSETEFINMYTGFRVRRGFRQPTNGLEVENDNLSEENRNSHRLSMTESDLLRFLKLHLCGVLDDSSTRGGAVAKMMRRNEFTPALGGSSVKGFSWQHMNNGLYGHAGIGGRSALYTFVFPSEQICGSIYSPCSSGVFVDILGKLGLLGAADNVIDTMQQKEDHLPNLLNRQFSNGVHTVRIAQEEGGYSLHVGNEMPGTGECVRALGGFQLLRQNLIVGSMPSQILPRVDRRATVELLGDSCRSYVRINDVVYASDKDLDP